MFMMVRMRMAIIKRPTISMYWNEKDGDPFIRQTMSRKLYWMISIALCMYDPQMAAVILEAILALETDNSFKCRTILDKLNEACSMFWHVGLHIALDESIVAMYHRSLLKQKFRNKVITVGARFFKVGNEFGYVFLNILDCQYTQQQYSKYDEVDRKGSQIVLYCLDQLGLLNSANATVLYIDTYYMSLMLSVILKQKNVYVNGTLRKNAADKPKNCTLKNGQKLLKGEFELYTNVRVQGHDIEPNSIFLVSMHDTKIFQHATTIPHNPGDIVDKSAEHKEQIDAETEFASLQEQLYDNRRNELLLKDKKRLQNLCRQNSLPVHRNKLDLVDRLLEHEFSTQNIGSTSTSNTEKSNDNITVTTAKKIKHDKTSSKQLQQKQNKYKTKTKTNKNTQTKSNSKAKHKKTKSKSSNKKSSKSTGELRLNVDTEDETSTTDSDDQSTAKITEPIIIHAMTVPELKNKPN